jgi:hypothetical protein
MNRHEPGVAATQSGAATPAGRIDRVSMSEMPAARTRGQVFGMGAGILHEVQARTTV